MHLIELFLPCDRGDGTAVPESEIQQIVTDLAHRFGGATAFTRSPATGLWKAAGTVEIDRIIIVEVMVEDLDMPWWREYRQQLEAQLQQEEVLIRATLCLTL
jgi:hypothetical protein